ncbi:hypothetical protein [Chamaesiphon sp. VAR_48_metabat_135_sub]|uniref:hypothetical protein n=1 Tax=Chamaesiphon sp. VAR_48_metabat_135_sub TaxID=2964699 RepID=UPI00286AF9C9|nr:hypothetical protein [Chamaesiphon sp. VAR_48_metabat_135_sub]
MYQSSNRNSFLDRLLDPTAIAILGSIALHASLGASLPFLTSPEKEAKKVDPGTVKVVELTPSELQRIPQVPPTPIPQPVAPSPTPPQFSTSPATIPFSPIRIPLERILPTPLPAKKPSKEQKAIPQKQPTAPIFDRSISFKPAPKPSQPPLQKITKPTPQPIAKKTQPSPAPISSENFPTDDDGSDIAPTTPTPSPNRQAQQPITPQPAITPQPSTSPSPQSSSNGFYGQYMDAALKQLSRYMTEYDVKEPYPSKSIVRSYPQGMSCSTEKQTPFIVMMAVFDKVPDNPDAAILGEGTAPSLKISTFKERDTPEQRTLAELATRVALEEANKADQNRPEKDKGKRVIYQYRVQFDPTTCKK